MRVLGVIPARGGSKGVPNKNCKKLYGKPLLQYTIEAALQSQKLDRVIFSSEDDQLITLAREFGVEVPFKRPLGLAQDDSPSIDFVVHALQTLSQNGDHYDAVCLLQVTSPFRTTKFIDEALEKFEQSGSDSLVSVLKVPHQYNPHWVFKADEKGNLHSVTGDKEIIKCRQDLPETHIRDGSIYLTKTEVVLKQNSLYGKRISFLESNSETYVNIDTMEDWKKAEVLAENLTHGH